jgi:hypothetical protein
MLFMLVSCFMTTKTGHAGSRIAQAHSRMSPVQVVEDIPFSLYPDYTVGPGITPGLLSLTTGQALAG